MFDKGTFTAYFNQVKEQHRNEFLGLLHLAKQLGDDVWAEEMKTKLKGVI